MTAEKATGEHDIGTREHWELRLYIAGMTGEAQTALANLEDICEKYVPGRYAIEVIDLLERPRLASDEQIFAVPTVVRKLPPPIRKLVGDLSDTAKVVDGLDLRERLKEQACLHAVSRLVADPLDSLDETLAAIADAIPPGWRYPAITGARITLGDRAIATRGFAETAWRMSAKIAPGGVTAGTVDVCYREQRPPADEGPFLAEERRLLDEIARQVGVLLRRERLAERQVLHADVLAALNRPDRWPALLRDLLVKIKAFTGCDAVGIRLRDGEEYPYYEQNGLPDEFVERERTLCARDENGAVVRDEAGNPVLACMCGAVITGNIDPAKPFFTENGSFWTNSITELRPEMSTDDRVAQMWSRCSKAGYESVALVPLRTGDETIGLLQVNDRRAGRFTPDLIAFFEEIGNSIGVAYTRVQAAEALKEGESKYRALFESSRDAIMTLVPPSWRFSSGNRAAVEMFGARDEADFIDRPPWEFSPAAQPDGRSSKEKAREMIETAMRDGNHFFEWRHRRLDGREFPATVLLTRFALMGRTLLQATVRDITEHKQAEEELRETNEYLRNTLDVLERTQQQVVRQERLRSLGQMASGIAHDFNNALTVIQGFSEMLLVRPEMMDDREGARESIERIHLAARDAAQVVRRMRSFYREDDEHEVRMPADLNKLIEEAVDLTRPKWQEQARADGVTIRIEKDFAAVPPVTLNAAEFREVLTNLIFNAVDAMAAGGTITFATRREGDETILRIADTGTGMTEEALRSCFDPFYSTKGTAGTGLGLSAAYGVVNRHGGTIDVASEEGVGTTFTICLPAGAVAPRKKPTGPAQAPGRSLKLLLVEDDEDVRKLIGTILAEAGHAVETAENGVAGLELFGEGWFDMVITDRAMPEMGGREFAAAVRDIAPSKPIIMLTGFGDIMEAADGKPEHVDTVIGKPVAAEEVLAAIEKLAPPA